MIDILISSLNPDLHDRTDFDCGKPPLNDYLRQTARQHQEKGLGNTYVLTNKNNPHKVIGYFTLSFLEVELSELPVEFQKKLPKTRLPAAKLGRLAVDSRYKGKGYGPLLLADAIKRVRNTIASAASVVALVVDAKDEQLAIFYSKFGFIRLHDASSLTLMMPLKTILATQESADSTIV